MESPGGNTSNLKTCRKLAGLSQKELADLSGVNLRTLQQYECGLKNINKASADKILAMSRILGCQMEDILETEEWERTMSKYYMEDQMKKVNAKLNADLRDMPYYVKDYLYSLAQSYEATTRYTILTDLRIFLNYLLDTNPDIDVHQIRLIPVEKVQEVTPSVLNDYIVYLEAYTGTNGFCSNSKAGIKRKLLCLDNFYSYHYRKGIFCCNPVSGIDMSRFSEHADTRCYTSLSRSEYERIIDAVESGSTMSEAGREKFHAITKYRDMAIIMLLAGTGMRIPELVSMDVDDIDLEDPETDANGNDVYRITVSRKSGSEDILYINQETADALQLYLDENRPAMIKDDEPELVPALFLSLRGSRINERSVQILVKKYAKVLPGKKVSPRTFRKTREINLYAATEDEELTAELLGKKKISVNPQPDDYVADTEMKIFAASI